MDASNGSLLPRAAFRSLGDTSARQQSGRLLLSLAAHAVVLVAVLAWMHRMPRIAPYRLPGTAKGTVTLTYYSPGSRRASRTPLVPIRTSTKDAPPTRHVRLPQPAPTQPTPPSASPGSGTSAESGLGEGNITIALLQHFPHPQPDLSALPHGARGDVILNAVIDDHGRITALTLLKGLGSPIDDAVIATVRQWSFTPATKDGVPVASEQELLFHYERS